MTTDQRATPPWPLSSEDRDWFALDGSWTRHEAARELHYNLLDWWVADQVGCGEDDEPIGQVAAFRAFLNRLRGGFVRPSGPRTDDEEVGGPDWWFPCGPDHPKAVPAWVWE